MSIETEHDAGPPAVALEYAVVADLQDQLLAASTDLERLTGLLGDAAAQLMGSFSAAHQRLSEEHLSGSHPDLLARLVVLRDELAAAVTALQFQDMSTQLVEHSVRRIRGVADYLGSRVVDDDGEAAPVELVTRSCPVAQRQMDAGSIELF